MTWEDELENCITNHKNTLSNKKLHLTPYMAKLIENTRSIALEKQFVPHIQKSDFQFSSDYLKEEEHSPIPNLVHRYRNKVIIIATNQCACYCQFCTRQRITHDGEISINNLEEIATYIEANHDIKDVLITGGDPLVLDTTKLVTILDKIEKISSVKIIRIGTRIPITLPQRINVELLKALSKYKNLYINIHINHPDELTVQSKKAILSLANAGIPLGSQSVLLKGINDNYEILKTLFEQLICIKVKPYYLYQCDKVRGCEDFIVDLQVGIDIVNKLCNEISGFAVPKFVVDTPEKGKMVLAPCSIKQITGNTFFLSNNSGNCSYENIK